MSGTPEVSEATHLANELRDAIRMDVVHHGDVPLHHAVEWTDDRLAQMWDLLTTAQRIEVLLDLRLHEELALRFPELHVREFFTNLDPHPSLGDRMRALQAMWNIIVLAMPALAEADAIVQTMGPPTLGQIVAAANAWGPPGPSRSPPSSSIMAGPLAQRPPAASVPVGTMYASTDGALAIACAMPTGWKQIS